MNNEDVELSVYFHIYTNAFRKQRRSISLMIFQGIFRVSSPVIRKLLQLSFQKGGAGPPEYSLQGEGTYTRINFGAFGSRRQHKSQFKYKVIIPPPETGSAMAMSI